MAKSMLLKDMPREIKIKLLKGLGYDSDGTFVLENGHKYLDKYINVPVKIDNMFIHPGTPNPGNTIILDNNPISIAAFFEDYGDVL